MTARWWSGIDPKTLRELASLADEQTRPVPNDPERMADELAQMLADGTRPTIGWYRKNYSCPPKLLRGDRPPKPEAVIRTAFYMVVEGYPPRIAARSVYDAAVASGMSHADAVECAEVGIARAGKLSHAD